MKKAIYMLGFFVSCNLFFAQRDHIAFFAGLELQPALNGYAPAFQMNGRLYVNDRISLGAALAYTQQNHSDNFGYLADRTRSYHTTFNLLAQNDLIQKENFSLGIYISTGMYFLSLVNPDETYTQTTYNQFEDVWFVHQQEVPRRLSRNLFYNIQPGLDLSYKLGTITKEKVGIYLTSRVGYQFVLGNGDITNGTQLTKPVVSLGITFNGPK
ncbi:hypothetical protein [Chryseobacterium taichungense]|uniref:hypothetical protein n=1 Tax=Chryseobacterium taichungense TaxID=295069 RepID=UPI0028A9320A|nr:hypothetical protein [Chryseobacterium taichungense]